MSKGTLPQQISILEIAFAHATAHLLQQHMQHCSTDNISLAITFMPPAPSSQQNSYGPQLYCQQAHYISSLACSDTLLSMPQLTAAIVHDKQRSAALHCLALPCPALQCTCTCAALHCAALYCAALHCTTFTAQFLLHTAMLTHSRMHQRCSAYPS